MKIAVIGCSHGSLDDIYNSIIRCDSESEKVGGDKIDLMICCGDFQAMRSLPDLQAMACPPKYRALGQFHNYYAERKKAPVLTIVIGGNHESSGYMWECYHGGWLAPDIYFLGFAGSILVDGWLRISGASGIWKSGDWKKGHFETVPYDDRTIRSVYHIREYDVARLLQLKGRAPEPDIFLSHDWPQGIEQHGDVKNLIREKPFFQDDIQSNNLGSPPLLALLTSLQPKYWFSAHLHVKFAALFHHSGAATQIVKSNNTSNSKAREYGSYGGGGSADSNSTSTPAIERVVEVVKEVNPDEILLEDEDEEEVSEVVFTKVEDVVMESVNPDEILLEEEEDEDTESIISEEPKGANCSTCTGNPDEIDLDEDEEEEEDEIDVESMLLGSGANSKGKEKAIVVDESRTTKFLALNKPGGGKDFLQVVDISTPIEFQRPEPSSSSSIISMPSILGTTTSTSTDSTSLPSPSVIIPNPRYRPTLYFDPYWLAIVKAYAPYLSLKMSYNQLPTASQADELIKTNYDWVLKNVGKEGIIKIDDVMRFEKTAPGTEDDSGRCIDGPPAWYTNPQTEAFCKLLSIPNQINPVPEGFREAQAAGKIIEDEVIRKRQVLVDEEKESREKYKAEEKKLLEEWQARELIKAREEALAELDVEVEADVDSNV